MKAWPNLFQPLCLTLAAGLFAPATLFQVTAKELKISPPWVVVVQDMSGAPKPGVNVIQTWSYWSILEDQSETKVTDEQGRVDFLPRSTSANPIRLKAAQLLGRLPHAGPPEPAATVRVETDDYKYLDQYLNIASGYIGPQSPDAKTEARPDRITTTFRLRPIDLIDAIARVRLDHDFTRAKAILAKDPSSARMVDVLGGTPLHRLYLHNPQSTEMAKLLIESGADIEAKDRNGETPLHVAAAHGSWEVVEMLLQKGAHPNVQTVGKSGLSREVGATPLHESVWAGPKPADAIKVIDALSKYGANVNAKNANGQTPLHRAAFLGDPSGLSELIAVGGDVNARDNQGQTPLHLAAFVGSPDRIKILLAHGADKNARDHDGLTPADLAKKNHKSKNIAELQLQ